MPRPPIQVHLFRVMTPHRVKNPPTHIQYPVTGLVVVPSSVSDVTGYIAARQDALAALRMPHLVGAADYSNTALAMMFAPDVRQSKGLAPRMPRKDLTHGQTAADCLGCGIIGLCTYNNPDHYPRLRERLEEVCRATTQYSADFRDALEVRLNTNAQ